MRRLLSAAGLISALVLPLAAHADTYSITNVVSNAPSGLGQTVGSQASGQATGNSEAIVLDFDPTGSGSALTSDLSFDILVSTAYGTETIAESGTNYTSVYVPGFESSLFTGGTPSISGPDVYSVVFSSDVNGSGSQETIYAELYPNSAFTPTPEPGSMVLLGTGLLGVVGAARRKLFNRA